MTCKNLTGHYWNCVEIISSKVVSSNKDSIVTIAKTLINPMDEFTVEIVTIPKTLSENIVSGVHGRIAGISKIDFIPFPKKGTESVWSWKKFFIGILSGTFAGFISALLFYVWSKLSFILKLKRYNE